MSADLEVRPSNVRGLRTGRETNSPNEYYWCLYKHEGKNYFKFYEKVDYGIFHPSTLWVEEYFWFWILREQGGVQNGIDFLRGKTNEEMDLLRIMWRLSRGGMEIEI